MTLLLLSLAGAALLGAVLASHRALSAAFSLGAPDAPEPARWPSLTVVRPIKGLDPGAAENLEALLATDYPGEHETLLVLDDADDPAYVLAADAVERHRAKGRRVHLLLSGRPPPERTGKLHAMIAAMERARGDVIAFSDSDTRPGPSLLRRLVARLLASPRAGAVFAPAIAVPAAAPTAGDAGYALLLNAWYAPAAALAAGRSGELPFIMGQIMVLPRAAIDAIGGLSCAEGRFVDDMWIGRCLLDAGRTNLQIARPLPVMIHGLSLAGFLRLFRRWVLFGRGGLPARFLRLHFARGLLYGLSVAALVAALAAGEPLAALLPAASVGAFAWSQLALQRRSGAPALPLRHAWVAVALPLLGAGALASALVSRRVEWRGRKYALDRSARLAPLLSRPVRDGAA